MSPYQYFIWIWLNFALLLSTRAQQAWTPIYVDGNSQVDLWTQESKGCMCPWDVTSNQCACCVQEGSCHCGRDAPGRCTQCGLEEHCNNMCNVTIISTELEKQSGKIFGQIKSPSIEGPAFCWFNFVPSEGQRIEVQIYRLVNIGRFANNSCIGGYLQLLGGSDLSYSPINNQVCGTNERYSPPVVLFSDSQLATLVLHVTEKTKRSQFLAYFSFTLSNNTEGLGFHPHGGMKLQNTDCDWLYQDTACIQAGLCVLASPSYPGLYPPKRQCKYHITTSSSKVRVRILFKSVLLAQNHCSTDYVAVYHDSTANSAHLITLCNNHNETVDYPGPKLVIEFRSGPQVPPYNYNGFLATLEFYEKKLATETSSVTTIVPVETTTLNYSTSSLASNSQFDCEILISGTNKRSGHFDTKEYKWFPTCRLIFKGRSTDVVHISLFNYRLRATGCQSVIEVFDGYMEDTKGPIDKICSPYSRNVQDIEKHNGHQKKFLSSGNVIVILFRRNSAPMETDDAEFLSGFFFFHDQEMSGTMQPTGLCDVKYKGQNSPSGGSINNPVSQHFYWNYVGPIVCNQHFAPAVNQSITIEVEGLEEMPADHSCVTQCGDTGCQCVTTKSMKTIDHLLLKNEDGWPIACFCGSFRSEWFPVSTKSWGPLVFVYSLSNYTWEKQGFKFMATYVFKTDNICGESIHRVHKGAISLRNISTTDSLNNFYYQSCVWTLLSNVERKLEIEISSNQNRPCTAWNISIHDYTANLSGHHLGELLYTFCSRETQKTYILPWKTSTAVIKLRTLSRKLPQFKIKWKAQAKRPNVIYGTPTASPNAVSSSCKFESIFSRLLVVLFMISGSKLMQASVLLSSDR